MTGDGQPISPGSPIAVVPGDRLSDVQHNGLSHPASLKHKAAGTVAVRDFKDLDGPALLMPSASFEALVTGVRESRFES
ncbi:DUF397 domain-containing protein [Streptomyces sp. NBC_00280]|uniref:DUF397 domain-containing protein n=1 Tax=Streptomyces sp. NBC_00280 TaxID=2975699 RepID=UPI00325255F5